MKKKAETLSSEEIQKLKRAADVLDSFSLKIVDSSKTMEDLLDTLKDEVSVLRRNSKSVQDSIQEKIYEIIPDMANQISTLLGGVVSKLSSDAILPIRKLEEKQQKVLERFHTLQRSQERKLKRSTIAIFLAFCAGSFLSGLGIWYFFPRTAYNSYDFTMEQRRAMEQGTLLQFAMKKMPKNEQEKLWALMGDSWTEYYEEMFSMKMPSNK